MQQLYAMMRSIEIHRLSSSMDDLTKRRRQSFSPDTFISKYSDGHYRFKRNFQKRRRSSEVEKIVAKYSSRRRSSSPHVIHSPDAVKKIHLNINETRDKSSSSLKTQRRDKANSSLLADVIEIPENIETNDCECYKNRIKSDETQINFRERPETTKIRSSKSYLNISLSTVIHKENISFSMENLSNPRKSPEKANADKGNLFLSASCLEMAKLKSVNFKEESILRRSASVDTVDSGIHNNSNRFSTRKNYPSESDLKWWQLKYYYRMNMFDCWIKWRKRKVGTYDGRIQEIDDGFFEKFGSVLRQNSIKAAKAEEVALAPLFENVPPSIPECSEETCEAVIQNDVEGAEGSGPKLALRFLNNDADSGNETLLDSDSESEDANKMDLYEMIDGWNFDELYKEIIYQIIHNVGMESNLELGQLALLSYVQDVFKMSRERHQEIMAEAEAKEPPEMMLNVEVIEAKDLSPKDPNGLSDPFVTMYLLSNQTQRYNTSVKPETLSPMWEEHFSLPINDNPGEDTLCLEVWDFDAAETVKEKMSKVFEVKGVKGLSKLMKEIALTASTGKHDNELIGKAYIPLKTIPTSGLTMWYSLDKKNKPKRQGVVKIRLSFSSQKNLQVACQEHRHLLKMLLLHELDNSKVVHYWWSGNFSVHADAIIQQHATLCNMSLTDRLLSQWIVYCTVHPDHPLSFNLFNTILYKLAKPITNKTIEGEDLKLFWNSVKKLLPSCFSLIRKIRKKTAGDKAVIKNAYEVLQILSTIHELPKPENFNLFPESIYGWIKEPNDNYNVKDMVVEAIKQGASDWFMTIVENNECKDKTGEGRLQHLIRVIQLVRSDLQRAIEYYDKIFVEIMKFSYSKCLFILYQEKVAELVKPEVLDICKGLKRLQYNESTIHNQTILAEVNGTGKQLGDPNLEEKPLAMGTTLFELYLVLQRFLTLGKVLCPNAWSEFSVSQFHQWFHGGVAQWLEIAVYKAMMRIEKAVDLDKLEPIDVNIKKSSSAVDTVAIFIQIKVFWEQLAWPDCEGSYTFVAKIIDDICRCCVFYADKMAQRVDNMGNVSTIYENQFFVTTEWCLAINNIDYVRQSLQPFVNDLGMDDIIAKLAELRSTVEADRCKMTLDNVIENAIDTVKNKIFELLEKVVDKMSPSINRFLVEGAEVLHQDCSSMDRVMLYLEQNLDTLHSQLKPDNFKKVLDVIWEKLSILLYNLVEINLEKRRPPSFFSNLLQCVNVMMESFKIENSELPSNENLDRINYLLKLHGFETSELIHQYYIERWEEQNAIEGNPFGQLSVRALFTDSSIKIEIINARNLMPMDSNGTVDSFVRINLLPDDLFAGTIRPKTQTHNKNCFPLYDETFTIILTPEQRNCKNGLIVFNVKDKDMFGMYNQYVAEAFLHFSQIPETETDIKQLPQVHLTLSRPTKLDGDSIKCLEHRQGDKQAKEFLKKQKQKINLTNSN